MTLSDLGWTNFFAAAFAPYAEQGLVPARVVAQKGLFQISTGEAEHFADLAGKLRHELDRPGGTSGYPAVGDWAARGELPEGRLASYRKLQRELRQIHLRQDELARREEKKKAKIVHKALRDHYRLKPRV